MAAGSLFDIEFRTARPGAPLFCHPDFLEKLSTYRKENTGKRSALLMQRLLVEASRVHYKTTLGANKGWRRSRLGGSSGNHFYAWWAPAGALPLRGAGGFESVPKDALFIRDIRHHDDHTPLTPQTFADYLPVTVPDLRREEYGPAPWTHQQSRFAGARDTIRLLKGHPGSGKTTALLHAVDASNASNVLYLTFSPDLASLARDYFERFCSAERKFHVLTTPEFFRRFTGGSAAHVPLNELRQNFRAEVYSFSRSLGPWADMIPALYDEVHAHMVGAATPAKAGRFAKCVSPRVTDDDYRSRRNRFLGAGVQPVVDVMARLEKAGGPVAPRFFPELTLAWQAAEALEKGSGFDRAFLEYDCIAVDECQDLTPLESFAVAKLAARAREIHKRPIPVLMAGDEAQTVRPTDFEWGWLSDILHHTVGTPSEHRLSVNLRSPRRIAEMVNRVWDLYASLEKQDRPSGQGWAGIDDDSTDQVLYCTAPHNQPLDTLFSDLTAREGMAIVCFGDPPAAIPAQARPNILSPVEIKGLDFHSVCIIDAGKQVEKATNVPAWRAITTEVDKLARRLAIDQLRVAISRPSERLIWLDLSPNPEIVRRSTSFLAGGRGHGFPVLNPEALQRALAEDELDVEERIQRCMQDARQYLAVRPELAWARAHQAVMLLGDANDVNRVQDPLARQTAYRTLAEICYTLGVRKVTLPPHTGAPDLFEEAADAAEYGRLVLTAVAIRRVGAAIRLQVPQEIATAVRTVADHSQNLEPWVTLELGSVAKQWLEVLEGSLHVGSNAALALELLPGFYAAMQYPDASERTAKLRKRALDLLMKNKQYGEALEALRKLPERQPAKEAACLDALGQHGAAAAAYRAAGDLESALDCYRKVPDFGASLALLRELGGKHPARGALEWVERMQAVSKERPADFDKVMKPAERKLLVEILETALGVQRKTPAAKKVAAKKVAKKAPVKGPRMPF